MKKMFSVVLIAALLILPSIQAVAGLDHIAGDEYTIIEGSNFETDFETGSPSVYTFNSANGSAAYAEIDAAHGKSAVLQYISGTGTTAPYLIPKMKLETEGIFVIEADFYVGSMHARTFISLKTYPSAAWLSALTMTNTGVFRYNGAGNTAFNANTDRTAQVGSWYNIRAMVDTVSWTYSVFLDGEKIVDNITVPVAGEIIDYLNFQPGAGSEGNPSIAAIDNIKQCILAKNYTDTVSCFDSGGGSVSQNAFPCDGGRVEISYTEEMNKASFSAVTVTDSNGKDIPFSGNYNEADKKYTIALPGDLGKGMAYTINLEGVKTALGGFRYGERFINFTAEKADFCILEYELDGLSSIKDAAPGSVVTLKVKIRNKNAENKAAMIAAGICDEFSLLAFKPAIVSGTDTEKEYALTFTAPGNIANSHLEIYLVNGNKDFGIIDMIIEE